MIGKKFEAGMRMKMLLVTVLAMVMINFQNYDICIVTTTT